MMLSKSNVIRSVVTIYLKYAISIGKFDSKQYPGINNRVAHLFKYVCEGY